MSTDLGVRFRVLGMPRAQGSKRGFVNPKTKKVVMVEQGGADLGRWRQDVAAQARRARPPEGPFDVAVGMYLRFFLTRPASIKRRVWPIVVPDLDKLVRASLDSIVAGGLITDDKLVVSLCASKDYADAEEPGLEARVWALDEGVVLSTGLA